MTLHNILECQLCFAIDFKGVEQHDGGIGNIFQRKASVKMSKLILRISSTFLLLK